MSNHINNQMEVLFYKYGLFSSRHPISMICLSAVIILSCCYPLLNLPIPGSEPQQFLSLLNDVSSGNSPKLKPHDFPPWYTSENRTAFIQQFIVKFSTLSWTRKRVGKNRIIKALLSTVFPLLNKIKSFSLANGEAINNDCFHVDKTVFKSKQHLKKMFPENDCLIISPASYWINDHKLYAADQDVLKTINQYESKTLKTPPSIKELLFGLSSKYSNLNLKNVEVSFAVTLILKHYNAELIEKLKEKLHSSYAVPILEPYYRICSVELENNGNDICSNLSQVVTHIRFKPQMRFNDLFPLLSTYFFLGCYIYFSVRKINFVKSKIGMAFSAVVSVIASLMMAVGLCSLIGLTPTLNGGEMFPYLVCMIGLENILVITKSIVSTHSHLDVDRRIAIGLSREGGSIIKNLLLEIALVGLGYFTYVPRINEFCAFAFVGILTDFFISMFFFVTVLSLDIRRLDVEEPYNESNDNGNEAVYPLSNKTVKKRTPKKSQKKLQIHAVSMENGGRDELLLKIPKRLKVVFFFADTRMIQRGLMVSAVVWASVLMYTDPTGFFKDNQTNDQSQSFLSLDTIASLKEMDNHIISSNNKINWGYQDLLSSHYLSFRHWPTLFAYYNISLSEKFISVLPPVLIPISYDQNYINKLIDEVVIDQAKRENAKTTTSAATELNIHIPDHIVRYQMTGLDYYITLIMGALSGIIIVYLLNILYRCICSRSYASPPPPTTYPGECVKTHLKGHLFKVDCMHVEGVTIASADMSGQLRTWDAHSGDCTCVISRENVLLPVFAESSSRFQYNESSSSENRSINTSKPSVWSIVSSGQFLIVGCSNGEIEVWDSVSCALQCKYNSCKGGIVNLACEDRRIVAARLTGRLDFFGLEDFMERQRTHKRTASDILLRNPAGNIVNLHLLNSVKSAHQQPICAFEMCLGRVLTGSRDHTLKLYNFHDAKCQFTMLGHSSPVTVVFMDKQAPAGAVSGSIDGTVWLWDLLSGKGLHKMKKHSAAVVAAQCSMHYIVSTAEDNIMCVWSRRTGSLLHVNQLDVGSCDALSLLDQYRCVTGGKGSLFLWDIRNGELIRRFPLVHRSLVQPSVDCISVSTDLSVVCIIGRELLVVRFPAVLEKD